MCRLSYPFSCDGWSSVDGKWLRLSKHCTYMDAESSISSLKFNVPYTAIFRLMFTGIGISEMSVLHYPTARRLQLRISGFTNVICTYPRFWFDRGMSPYKCVLTNWLIYWLMRWCICTTIHKKCHFYFYDYFGTMQYVHIARYCYRSRPSVRLPVCLWRWGTVVI